MSRVTVTVPGSVIPASPSGPGAAATGTVTVPGPGPGPIHAVTGAIATVTVTGSQSGSIDTQAAWFQLFLTIPGRPSLSK